MEKINNTIRSSPEKETKTCSYPNIIVLILLCSLMLCTGIFFGGGIQVYYYENILNLEKGWELKKYTMEDGEVKYLLRAFIPFDTNRFKMIKGKTLNVHWK